VHIAVLSTRASSPCCDEQREILTVAHITSSGSASLASYDGCAHWLAVWRRHGLSPGPRQPNPCGWRGLPRFDGPTGTRLGAVDGNPTVPRRGTAGFHFPRTPRCSWTRRICSEIGLNRAERPVAGLTRHSGQTSLEWALSHRRNDPGDEGVHPRSIIERNDGDRHWGEFSTAAADLTMYHFRRDTAIVAVCQAVSVGVLERLLDLGGNAPA